MPDPWVHQHEGGSSWSPYDIVGHLIHGEVADWIPRLRIVIEHGEARPFDRFNREAQFTASAGRPLGALLEEFAERRAASLAALDACRLQPADLDRRGRHPELGPVTVRQLLATWVAHDFDHLMQVTRVLGRQFSDEVGPWRAYLRVVSGQPG